MRSVIVTQTDDKSCHTIGHTGVHHSLTDGKRAGNRNQEYPTKYIWYIYGRGNILVHAMTIVVMQTQEKHIQLDIGKHLFGHRQFAHRSTDNHQHQQDQRQPALLLSLQYPDHCRW